MLRACGGAAARRLRTVKRAWTGEARKALLDGLGTLPGASVEELDGTEDMATQLRMFQGAAAIVGVHGAGMTNAPFATRPVCIVEIGAWLNVKFGQGLYEWRSTGMISHWSPDLMHWIMYRLMPQELLPPEYRNAYFRLRPHSEGDGGLGGGQGTRDHYLLDVPRLQVPARHVRAITDLVAGSWAWRGEPRRASKNMQFGVIDCQPKPCHNKHGHQPIWFHG